MSKILAEINRRHVIQTFIPYLGFVWLLLQIVSVVAPMLHWHPLVSTFFAVVLFAGIPVMLYLSWYFDFTLQGLVPIADKESGETRAFGLVRWTVLILISLGSGSFGYQYFHEVKVELAKTQDGLKQNIKANSIAVLPFKDNSPDQDQGFLAQGLAEEITSLLGRIDGLKVSASSSTSILSEKGLDAVTIARRLAVQTILTGSVRKTGDQLKVIVELINAEDGAVLWTESFARKFEDIFSVETEIARSTVNLLQDTYIESGTLTNPAASKSVDAYVLYLKGREQYRQQTTESMKQARKLFEQALGLDPEYAQAYVALADTIVLLAEGPERFGVLKVDIAATLAKQHLDKAIVRQPELPMAFALYGYIPFMLNNPAESLTFFDKAITLNPNLAIARVWKSLALKDLQRHDESLQELKLAFQIDPLSLAIIHNLGFKYSERRNFTKANQFFEKLVQEYPESPLGYVGLADVAYSKGDYVSSLKYWRLSAEMSPENEVFKEKVLACLLALKMPEQFKRFMTDATYKTTLLLLEQKYQKLFDEMHFQMSAAPDDPWLKFEAAIYYMQTGNSNQAIELLIQADHLIPESDKFDMPYCSPAIEIAWAYKKKNLIPQANKLIDECDLKFQQSVQSAIKQSEINYLGARIYALKSNVPESLQQFSIAIEHGWRDWWTEKDPLLSTIADSPEFQKQVAIINSDLTSQRKKALTLFNLNSE
ncbi:hypothetical protein [uncultured Paraglaciecola sp.]|uniref:hypothetical protein n=1 Tax=uncultured Paraglaciecola sp. TaxID=1765024 RepID=UPI00260BA2AC|nr:hypothetical protein [uncultured Paraglaciecola sp.]